MIPKSNSACHRLFVIKEIFYYLFWKKTIESYSLLGYADYSKTSRTFFFLYSVHHQCEEP